MRKTLPFPGKHEDVSSIPIIHGFVCLFVKPGRMVGAWNPSALEADTGGLLRPAGWPANLAFLANK